MKDSEERPLISIITPVYNGTVAFIRAAFDSLKKQTYGNWEWCVCDDGSTDPAIVSYVRSLSDDKRASVKFLNKNSGISLASNEAVKLASGSVIAFLDFDDELHEDALMEVADIFKNFAADIVYTDEALKYEDRLVEHRKPRFSPHYLLSTNYICHFLAVKKDLFDSIGGFKAGFEGSQDHDLVLRLTNASKRVFHIPKVLYYWRKHSGSFSDVSKSLITAAVSGIKAVSDELRRRGILAEVTNPNGKTHYKIKPTLLNNPQVSIVIATHATDRNINVAIDSIVSKTYYDNYEIVVISDNIDGLKNIYKGDAHVKTIHDKSTDFRLSRKLNSAIRQATGQHIIIMHDDVRITNSDWIEWLLSYSQDPLIGIVGCKILNQNGTVQNFGLAVDSANFISQLFSGLGKDEMGHMGRAVLTQNVSAVPSALMMFKKDVFDKVGGFDENFYGFHFDVDFCIRVKDIGLFNVAIPYCTVTHLGTSTRFKTHGAKTPTLQALDEKIFRTKHAHSLKNGDPYYNPFIISESVLPEQLNQQENKKTFIVQTDIGQTQQYVAKPNKEHSKGLVSYIVPWYQQVPVVIPSLLAQSYTNIEIIIVHDGPIPPEVRKQIEYMGDSRIHLLSTPKRYNDWGHTPRDFGIDILSSNSEAVVFTGVDNYYFPSFTDEVFSPIATSDLIVASYCNMIHNNKNWMPIEVSLDYGKIDCGCFIVRSEAAREFRWGNRASWEDWIFIEKVIKKYGMKRIAKVPRMLYVHN